MPDVAEPVATGDLGLDLVAGARGDLPGHVEDRDGLPGADVVGGVRRVVGVDDGAHRQHVGPGHVVDVHEVAHLAAVLVDLRCLAALERGAEHRRDPGVRRVLGHAGPVDVVVPQCDGSGPGLPHPRGRVVLLGQLARRVGAARVEAGVLVHQGPGQRRVAGRAVVLEVTGVERSQRTRSGHLRAVGRAGVAALAVDHHRRRHDQAPDPGLVHRRHQGGRAEVVVAGVLRQVGHRDARTDEGGLVTHHVDAPQQLGPLGGGRGLAHVEGVGAERRLGAAVRVGEHDVDGHDLVPGRVEPGPDRGADEASGAGEQDLHELGTG